MDDIERKKEIARQRAREWYRNNKDRALGNVKRRYAKKRKEIIKYISAWRARNPDKVAIYEGNRKYDPVAKLADCRKYQAKKINATPKWANHKYIKLWYKLAEIEQERTGEKVHVDHIIPLKSDIVCGLHCEDNLQLLFAFDNLSKANKFDPDNYQKENWQ